MGLTKHKEGSLRELWAISLPLMISSFSVMSMLFVDRLLLANYSTDTLNAAVNSSTLGWVFVYGFMVMTSISEVFVAQYNGAGLKEKLGEPVWQMIWLGVCTIFFFLPLAFFGAQMIYGEEFEYEATYFFWMMCFGPFFALFGALCGFFIGQGKTVLVTTVSVIANLINAAMDIILIFGIEGWVPSYGIKGAAIGTSFGAIFQVLVLGTIFLKKENRRLFGTSNYRFNLQSFRQCLRVGAPGAVFVAIEILGWAIFYWMMTHMGQRYITIVGICQSIAILLYFFGEGISKAATALTGNFIGAKKQELIAHVIRAGVKLHLLFFGLILLLLSVSTEQCIQMFLPEMELSQIEELRSSLVFGLVAILLYTLMEGIRLLLAGILTATGDTVFLMVAGSICIWLFLVLPVYMFVVKIKAPVEVASFFCVFYATCACLIYLWRFMTGKWKEISITA